jgi:small subunit ribosomal protein S15
MPLTTEKKAGIFTNFGGAAANTGSIEAQIAAITERMAQRPPQALTELPAKA